jgi:hypothetical protein
MILDRWYPFEGPIIETTKNSNNEITSIMITSKGSGYDSEAIKQTAKENPLAFGPHLCAILGVKYPWDKV